MDSEVICEEHDAEGNVKADNGANQFVNGIWNLASSMHQYGGMVLKEKEELFYIGFCSRITTVRVKISFPPELEERGKYYNFVGHVFAAATVNVVVPPNIKRLKMDG